MASNVKPGKRRHVMTEKMQAFVRAQSDANSPVRLLHCPHEGCNKVLTSSPGLRYHLKAHFQDRPFTCERCNKTFKSSNGLKYHLSKTKCVFPQFQKWLMPVDHDDPDLYPTLSSTSEEEDEEDDVVMSDTDLGHYSGARALKRSRSMDDHYEAGGASMKKVSAGAEKGNAGGSVVYVKPDGSVVTAPSGRLTPADETDEYGSGEAKKAMSTLEELAIFATSMQSPLVRKTPPADGKSKAREDSGIDTESSQESVASQNEGETDETPTVTPAHSPVKEEPQDSDSRVTSSSPCPAAPNTLSTAANWSHTWPDTVWQCFSRGTRARFITGKNTDWQLVENIAETEELARKACMDGADNRGYAPGGLKLLHIEEVQCKEELLKSILRLRFVSTTPGQAEILVESEPDHPFFVKGKGWSSFHPSQTVKQYGIPCNELESGDVCLPPDHPDATYSKDVFECMKNYKFTPMDSSAVFTLSNMAKQKRHVPSTEHRNLFAIKKNKKMEMKTKRPMNAFMLFAKQFRLQYTQAYPGKDNRAISILLGDQWKRLTASQRQVFSRQAKKLADQQRTGAEINKKKTL